MTQVIAPSTSVRSVTHTESHFVVTILTIDQEDNMTPVSLHAPLLFNLPATLSAQRNGARRGVLWLFCGTCPRRVPILIV